MIRTRHFPNSGREMNPNEHQLLIQGIATEVLNPKRRFSSFSFIPQFVMLSKGHPALQFLLLGSISVSLNTAVDLLVVVFAAAVAKRIRKSHSFNTRQRAASGVRMIGLGVYVAVADNH
jgi:threonine/homoserine/homoserine lactone efflux protein